ncbi:MAG TPA: glycoside hydrolase family 3 C-terminal domain-containing protein, partial [Flavisolibacter sp.]|nr:glycoside hydrolase family 3 C-terminal domain-containing protein [Flavisolibacter sp.]
LKIEVVSKAGGNTARRTDFFNMVKFSTVTKSGTVKEFDATKFDASANGLITSARFGSASVRGIKDGDWTAYNNVDITDVDSIRFNMTVSGDGGTIEVRVVSATGNILASKKVDAPQQSGGGGFFARPQNVSAKLNTLGISGPQTIVLVYRETQPAATDKETLDLAASSDVALVFVGTDQTTGREESDRFSITLPGNQNELIKSIASVNPNTIVVIQGMGMVEVEQFKNNPNIAGIIFTGYNGQAQGAAMAKILFGEVNPGGKSAFTWYKSLSDLPDFNDYTLRGGNGKNGRTYMYFSKDVSYEFGYGLSYTSFGYSNFGINKNNITPNDKVTVSVDVKNTGVVDGDEIIQIYVRTSDSPASLQRPIKRLKGFKRVTIPKGQTKTVSIDVDCADLWFWDAENKRITFDPGKYIFEIGASSKDIRGTVEANMSGTYNSVLSTVVLDCEKVVLKPGDKAQTSVSAAMSDDSFFDTKKANVTYKSNNPSVATVDGNGNVTAISPGTASIFASVTINGTTLSNSASVKVMPDLSPKSIKLNGKDLAGFNKDTKAYSFLLKKNEKLPIITAAALSNNIVAEVEQAKGIPGTAVVRFTDNSTFERNTYYLNFDVRSVSDEFNGEVGKQWQWIRENKSTYSLSKNTGALTITTEPGDVSEASNNAKNILLQSANADWVAETKLVGSRTPSQPENAGILAYQDENNFVKLMLRAVTKTTRQPRGSSQPGTIDLVVEENGIAKSVASFNLTEEITGNNALRLKLEKTGNTYTGYYAINDGEFVKLGVANGLLKDIKAGLIACDGVIIQSMKNTFWFDPSTTKPDTPFDVTFDYFRITNK